MRKMLTLFIILAAFSSWFVFDAVAGSKGQQSSERDEKKLDQTAQRFPVIWDDKFSAQNRNELNQHLSDLWDEVPDLSASYKIGDDGWDGQKPINTCSDWVCAAGHQKEGHFWSCRESIYYFAFGPRELFRSARTSSTSQFTAFSMMDIEIDDIPECLWYSGPYSTIENETTTPKDLFDKVELCDRTPTSLCLKMGSKIEVSDDPDTIYWEYETLSLSYVGRADFNYDGAEDLILAWHHQSGGSGFSFGHVIVSKPTADSNMSFTPIHGGGH